MPAILRTFIQNFFFLDIFIYGLIGSKMGLVKSKNRHRVTAKV